MKSVIATRPPTPAAASGPIIETLRSTCSRERCDILVMPCWSRPSSSSIMPARTSSGIWEITCSAPWSAPTSVAHRPHSPAGSDSRGMLGMTVSHTACSTARLDSFSSLIRLSSIAQVLHRLDRVREQHQRVVCRDEPTIVRGHLVLHGVRGAVESEFLTYLVEVDHEAVLRAYVPERRILDDLDALLVAQHA